MAPRINTKTNIVIFCLFMFVVVGVFGLLIGKHYEISLLDLRDFTRTSQQALVIASAETGLSEPCAPGDEMTIFSPTVYVCNEPKDELVYDEIYNLYPASPSGPDFIYDFITTGEKARADEMLENIYNIERYEPVTLTPPLTWTEDPYNEQYWRFLFYSLRPLRHLLATAEETRAERYYEKSREILNSFLDQGMESELAWADPHAVAFRTMMLVHAWWHLREAGELPSDLSDKLLAALEQHGDYLVDPENYEDDYNHGVTQSSALLLLAKSFPDLASAEAWEEMAIRRIRIGLSSIVDANGVLNENSPYYHFYVLEKYWQIQQFADAYSIEIDEDFNETIDQMVNFSTYILQPDNSVPLLGASIPRTITRSGEFAEMAEENQELTYVLSQGEHGKRPAETSTLFPSSGMAILRSGWGDEIPFTDETYLLYDTGPYRTDHSDLDALTFSLFSYNAPIIRDTGLFTYENENIFYNYFHGTRGHNTVIVDDTNQAEGQPSRQQLYTEDGYAYLAAHHALYPNVQHSRTVALIDHDTVIIIDNLESSETHTYEQLFHFPSNAELKNERTPELVTGKVKNAANQEINFAIEQIVAPAEVHVWQGQNEPVRGFCAGAYEKLEPCPELAFTVTGTGARYITLIQLTKGAENKKYQATYDEADHILTLTSNVDTYVVDIAFPDDGILNSEYINLTIEKNGESDWPIVKPIRSFLNNIF